MIYIANWKIYLSYQQEIKWVKENLQELGKLARKEDQVIICSSFVSLSNIKELLNNTTIGLGAQNCASNLSGAYTGEVSVISLKEIGCNYCIIGHSERRQYFCETDKDISLKIKLLFENNIIPILCVGETEEEHKKNQSKAAIESQLKNLDLPEDKEIIIAYEPIWSIGTGITPSNKYIEDICLHIKSLLKTKKHKIVYGGSVNQQTVVEIKKVASISGFLIGKASTDFQEFKKIVLL